MANPKPLLSDLVSTVTSLPSNYIRPLSDRPNLNEVIRSSNCSIPLIDLQGLDGPYRSTLVKQIGLTCQDYGFFQMKKHGISKHVIDEMLSVSREFFHLPESERIKNYFDDPMKSTRLSTSFNVKTEKTSNWRDFLRLHCYPLEDYIQEWPSNPPSFRVIQPILHKWSDDNCSKLLKNCYGALPVDGKITVIEQVAQKTREWCSHKKHFPG